MKQVFNSVAINNQISIIKNKIMSKKLDELKKQAAEIAEQIKKLEAESPDLKLRRTVEETLFEYWSMPDKGMTEPFIGEIMEAVNEYASEAVSELEDALKARDYESEKYVSDKLAEAKSLLSESELSLNEAKKKIADSDARIDALEDALQDAGKTERRLLSDIEEKDDILIKRSKRISELESLLNNRSYSYAELEKELAERDARIAELESVPLIVDGMEMITLNMFKKRAERIAELESALGTRDEMVKWLKENIQSVKSINGDLADVVSEKDARIAELEKQLAEKDEQLINVSAELKAVRSDRDAQSAVNAAFVNDGIVVEEIEKETSKIAWYPAIEYLKEFPEPWRTAALRAVEERPSEPSAIVSSAADALAWSFNWADETDKWATLHLAILKGTEWPDPSLFQ